MTTELIEPTESSKAFSLGYIAGQSDSYFETIKACIDYIKLQGHSELAEDLVKHFGIK